MSKSIVLETIGPCLLFLEEQRGKIPVSLNLARS